jgi:hypothetical protein
MLRLKMKVYTDPVSGHRFMVAVGSLSPALGLMNALLLSDELTRFVLMSVEQWNALEWCYFKEDGPASSTGNVLVVP